MRETPQWVWRWGPWTTGAAEESVVDECSSNVQKDGPLVVKVRGVLEQSGGGEGELNRNRRNRKGGGRLKIAGIDC